MVANVTLHWEEQKYRVILDMQINHATQTKGYMWVRQDFLAEYQHGGGLSLFSGVVFSDWWWRDGWGQRLVMIDRWQNQLSLSKRVKVTRKAKTERNTHTRNSRPGIMNCHFECHMKKSCNWFFENFTFNGRKKCHVVLEWHGSD